MSGANQPTTVEPGQIDESAIGPVGTAIEVPEAKDVGVVLVDDERMTLRLVEAHLERLGHPVRTFTDPSEAIASIRREPPQVVVTDIVMPGAGGLDVAEAARVADPDVGVILITSLHESAITTAVRSPGVTSVLQKPIKVDPLRRAIQQVVLRRAAAAYQRSAASWMYDAMARNAAAIQKVTMSTLAALVNAVDARSPHFRGHSQAVAMQAAAVAQALGLDEEEIETIRIAGLLHDVGMIGIPDSIIEKPGTLTPEEQDRIRGHCTAGEAILEPMQHLGPVSTYVLQHHERWNGEGYPNGLREDEIALGGQIVGIAEAWTGLIESRAYRGGRTREEGLDMIARHRGTWFSADVTEALLESDVGLLG